MWTSPAQAAAPQFSVSANGVAAESTTEPRSTLPRRLGAPEIVAHRGASEFAPEHTLAAYRQALDVGADALECDVRLTADGHLVCVHDRTIDRTSDGQGVVATMTLDELNRHDFGRWYARRRAGRLLGSRSSHRAAAADPDPGNAVAPTASEADWDEERQQVLTLETLLELIADTPRQVGLAIETKHPSRFAGLVEQRVVEALDQFGLARPPRDGQSPVRVMSFSELAVRRMRSLAPGIPTVYLMQWVPVRMRRGLLPYGARIAGPSIAVLRRHPGYVDRVHRVGGRVHVWTVNDSADIDLCLRLGVDAIITNRPAAVLAQVGR